MLFLEFSARKTAGQLSRCGRVVRALLICAGSIVALASCNDNNVSSLDIGISGSPGYGVLYLAQEQGYFRDEGVNVRIVEFPSHTDLAVSLLSRQLDGAAMNSADLARLNGRAGGDLRAVWAIDSSDIAVRLQKRQSIRSVADLRARKVAVDMDPVGLRLFRQELNAAGLDYSDLTVVNLDQSAGERALFRGEVDAVVTSGPMSRRSGSRGAAGTLDGKFSEELVGLLGVRSAALEERRTDVRKLLSAYRRALAFLASNPQEAVEIMARRLRMAPDQYRLALEREVRLLGPADQAKYLSAGGVLESVLASQRELLRMAGQRTQERLIESIPMVNDIALTPGGAAR